MGEEWGRKIISVSERGIVVGVTQACLSVSETADQLGFSHTGFTEHGLRN